MAFKYTIFNAWIHAVYFMSTNFVASNPEYLGCFLNQDINISIVSITPLTYEVCSDECLSNNYTYAAFSKSFCRCTNNYMSKLMKVKDEDCNISYADNISNNVQMFRTQNTSEEQSYPQAIYLGCYAERKGDDENRLLKNPHERFDDNTPQKCSEECFQLGFLYSGTTNGEKPGTACWCGNQNPSIKFKINDSKCDVNCSGDKTKKCGGFWKLSVYSTGIVDYPLGNLVGCFNLDHFNRTGKTIIKLKDTEDSHRCFYICSERGYKYAAISEDHCECSDYKPSIDEEKKQDECKPCDGDVSEYCGGPTSVSVYEDNWLATGNLSEHIFGCFKNSWMYPVMEGWNVSFTRGLTSQNCVSSCYYRGYPYAALISSKECLCSFVSPSLDAKVDGRYCNNTCDPEGSEHICGDHKHYNVFTTGLQTARVAGDYYMGCYNDNGKNDKTLEKDVSFNFPSANTPHICSKHCGKANFRYFGLTQRKSCWCTNTPPGDGVKVNDINCSIQCPGNANKYCGGPSTAAVFRIGMVVDIINICSTDCDCYYSPKYNMTTIDCSKRNLTKSPKHFPNFNNTSSQVELILKDNFFEFQPNLTSLNITSLDLSNNNITTLNANFFPKSLKALYINNNKLTSLNDGVLKLIESLNTITLKNNPWPCECYLRTILLKYKSKIEDLDDITCSFSSQPLIYMNEYDLCKKWKINYFYIGLTLGFISFICCLSIYFNLHKTIWLYLHNIQCQPCGVVSVQYNKNSSETFMQRIKYDELVIATDNWNPNNILGRGGFGVVYKGNWRHTDVAIKRLITKGVAEKVVNMHTLAGDELLNPSKEIMYLNAIKHDNILSMYGFCLHPAGSCLIYQYMANGSLEDRLQQKNTTNPLSWPMRGNITLGIARGLQFLHNMETPLIHGDIKSANILLDTNFEPRIGDFGLARTGPLQDVINKNVGFDVSHVCGTRPYLPDDFCMTKKLSTKVDTYSFGVVMFEIATGLRAFNRYKNYTYLKEFVTKHDKNLLFNIADKTAGQDSLHVFEALISLGTSCVAKSAEARPEMVVVYMNLQNVMSSNVNIQRNTVNSTKLNINNAQSQETGTRLPQTNFKKLDGIKATLLAPLHEIPSISDLYSDTVCEILDDRKINSVAELKTDNNEISVCHNGFKYHKMR